MTQHSPPEKIPHVEENACRACEKCVSRTVCRTKAIMALDPGEAPFIDSSRCHGCRICIPACPAGAVVV